MLTRKRKIDFKQLVDVKLQKANKKIKVTRSESQLYDIEMIEDDPSTQRVKITILAIALDMMSGDQRVT